MTDAAGAAKDDPTSVSLFSRTVWASTWVLLSYAGTHVLRLGGNLILTRLLFPEAFGLMALVYVFLLALEMFADVGIHHSIVQSERGADPDFLHTAWTLQIARGFCLWLLATLTAWPCAAFYEQPELGPLIAVMALNFIVEGFNSPKIAMLVRQLSVGRLISIDLAARILSIVVMVVWASFHRSVWALLAGRLAASVLRLVLSHVAIAGPRDRIRWDAPAARSILNFGKWIFVSSLVGYLSMQLDILMLGKLAPIELVGIYNIGLMLATIPREVAGHLTGRILFPVLAESEREGRARFAASFRTARGVLLPGSLFIVLAIVLLAPHFFEQLYDQRYHDAGWIAQLSMVPVWIALLQACSDRALLALGDSRSLAISNTTRLIVTACACLLGFFWGGLPGFILGAGCGAASGHAVVQMRLRRHGIGIISQDVMFSLVALILGVVGVFGPGLVAPLLGVPKDTSFSLAWASAVLVPFGVAAALRLKQAVYG